MGTQKVGIREFRDKLASYVESEGPVAITRHGDTVGLYIPVRRKRTAEDWARFDAAAARVDEMLEASGISEDELVEEFKKLRAADRSR